MAGPGDSLDVRCGDLVRTRHVIAGAAHEVVGRVNRVLPEYVVVGPLAVERGEVVEIIEEAEAHLSGGPRRRAAGAVREEEGMDDERDRGLDDEELDEIIGLIQVIYGVSSPSEALLSYHRDLTRLDDLEAELEDYEA